MGYSTWGHKDSDTTERLTLTHIVERTAFGLWGHGVGRV